MKNPKTHLKKLILASALALAGIASANAEMVFTGKASYYEDPTFGGTVLKLGYGGTGSGTLAEGKTWTEQHNLLIGCCPNNYSPSYFTIYGTANTQKNVYVSGIQRSGHCLVDGGTWNCGGTFMLGIGTYGTLTINNGGDVNLQNTFQINSGSTLTITGTSTLELTLSSSGELGENGGIHVYNDLGGKISLDSASNLVINTSNFTTTPISTFSLRAETQTPQSDLVIEDFITVEKKYAKTLSTLLFTVNGNEFNAGDETELNKHLSGITVLGYEDYEKSFVVDSANQTVALHLSKIPEPSAFGLLAGLGALAIVSSRRNRRHLN